MQDRFDIVLGIILSGVIAADSNFWISCFGMILIVSLLLAFFRKGKENSSKDKTSQQ